MDFPRAAGRIARLAVGLMGATSLPERDLRYAVALLTDTRHGTLESFIPWMQLLP